MKTKDFLYCESRADIPMGYIGYVYIAEMNSIFYYDNFYILGRKYCRCQRRTIFN